MLSDIGRTIGTCFTCFIHNICETHIFEPISTKTVNRDIFRCLAHQSVLIVLVSLLTQVRQRVLQTSSIHVYNEKNETMQFAKVYCGVGTM